MALKCKTQNQSLFLHFMAKVLSFLAKAEQHKAQEQLLLAERLERAIDKNVLLTGHSRSVFFLFNSPSFFGSRARKKTDSASIQSAMILHDSSLLPFLAEVKLLYFAVALCVLPLCSVICCVLHFRATIGFLAQSNDICG